MILQCLNPGSILEPFKSTRPLWVGTGSCARHSGVENGLRRPDPEEDSRREVQVRAPAHHPELCLE
jgi:hypothetical protein